MALLATLIIGTTYWQAWAESDLSARQDNALQRVAQFKIDRGDYQDRGRQAAGAEPRPARQRQHVLPAPLPDRASRLRRGRLLDARPLARRPRAVVQRLPDRLQLEPRHGAAPDARLARGQDRAGQLARADAPPRAAVPGPEGARRLLRRGGRTRRQDRQGARDGHVADVQPEPRRATTSTRSRTRRRRASRPRRHCSTAPPPGFTSRARPSSSSPPPLRSTAARSRRTRLLRPGLLRRVRQARSTTSAWSRAAPSASDTSRSPRGSSTRSTLCTATSGRSSARSRSWSTRRSSALYTSPRPGDARRNEQSTSGLYNCDAKGRCRLF